LTSHISSNLGLYVFTSIANLCERQKFEPICYLQIREGLYYNPYFPGGAIAMPKMLADEGTEYDDGTAATEAQQAKASFVFVPPTYA